MPQLLPPPKFRAVDDLGAPLVGGKLYTFTANTSTPKDSYTDYTLGAANTNPVILDARGEADVWLDGAYKVRLLDADDVLVWEVNDIRDLTDSQTFDGATFSNSTLSGTLTISSTAVTWSGNPTHSGNHVFSGNVSVQGNTSLGNGGADTLTVASTAVTWSNNPTHSGNHTFSGVTTLSPPSGTFTPALTFGGAAVGMTFATRAGNYFQIGDTVFFNLSIRLFAKGSSTGTAVITGLPFTVSATSESCLSVVALGMSSLSGPPVALCNNSATTIAIGHTSTVATGAQTLMTDSNFTSSSVVLISGTFRR